LETTRTIRERRSINFFEAGRELPESTLRELLELANLAPSSFNLQPWKVIAVRDQEKKKILRACAMGQPKAEEASCVLIMVADPRGVEENIEKMLASWVSLGYLKAEMREDIRKMAMDLYGPPDSIKRRLFAVKNTGLFAMNLMLAAKGMGLETHPMDGMDEACIKREFGIREDCDIPMLVAVGWLRPGVKLLPRSFRRNIGEFVKFL
jgi:nitroreductase